MATAKKATAKKTTTKQPDPPSNGSPSDELVSITHEEFFNVMQQLYPEQTARVFSEIKSAKLEQLVRELRGEA